MRVKINDVWYDSKNQSICIKISDGEQKQIAEMDRSVATQGKYAVFPNAESMTREEMLEWMGG